MKVKQLMKVAEIKVGQHVKINDGRNYRTIETSEGWILEPDYDYEGFNYDEIERIKNMTVDGMEFSEDCLTIWVH